jgi:hypothetical protein
MRRITRSIALMVGEMEALGLREEKGGMVVTAAQAEMVDG